MDGSGVPGFGVPVARCPSSQAAGGARGGSQPNPPPVAGVTEALRWRPAASFGLCTEVGAGVGRALGGAAGRFRWRPLTADLGGPRQPPGPKRGPLPLGEPKNHNGRRRAWSGGLATLRRGWQGREGPWEPGCLGAEPQRGSRGARTQRLGLLRPLADAVLRRPLWPQGRLGLAQLGLTHPCHSETGALPSWGERPREPRTHCPPQPHPRARPFCPHQPHTLGPLLSVYILGHCPSKGLCPESAMSPVPWV